MDAVDPDTLVLMGRIWRAHGIRGELKVLPETDVPERFGELDVVYVGSMRATSEPRRVERARYQPTKRGTTVLLKLGDVETREEADLLRKQYVFAHESDLPPLEEDEVFLHDLLGLRVVTDDGEEVGVVVDAFENPAQLVYVIERPDGSEAMIPDVPAFVVELDLEERTLVVQLIEGLLES